MKKFIQLTILFAAIATLAVLQSCKDEEKIQPAPSVTVDPTSASNIPGAKVTANIIVNAPNGGKILVSYVSGVEAESFDIAGEVDFTKAYEYTVPTTAIVGSKIIISFQAIDNKDYPSAVANFVVTVGSPIVELTGNLTTQSLDASKPYLLKGQVFVPSGVTLTIPEGTVIKGDKATKAALIVQPGGTLIANGSAAKPIVFTSAQNIGERDRGDWGGVLILGNAWVNQTALPAIEGITPSQTYGNITSPTTNATDNSGSLNYVRIEYAGVELTPNNETNSLTMGGVGSGTTIDYVQVSFGGDDGFEWFGGSVNAKHLVSHSTWDDDFDTDFGWAGNVQWALAVRNPFFADQSGSASFESDNQANANDTPSGSAGYTRGVFSNVTVLGPRDYLVGTESNLNNPRPISGNYFQALHIRRRTALSIFNSFISGFPIGLRMDDDATITNFTQGSPLGFLQNNVIFTPRTANTSSGSLAANYATSSTTPDAATALTNVTTYWTTNNITEANTGFLTNGSTKIPTWGVSVDAPVAGVIVPPYATYGINLDLFFAKYTAATYPSNPNFAVSSGSLTGQTAGTLFANTKLTGGFFDTTLTYKGAFGSTDWTDTWSEFQPQSKAY